MRLVYHLALAVAVVVSVAGSGASRSTAARTASLSPAPFDSPTVQPSGYASALVSLDGLLLRAPIPPGARSTAIVPPSPWLTAPASMIGSSNVITIHRFVESDLAPGAALSSMAARPLGLLVSGTGTEASRSGSARILTLTDTSRPPRVLEAQLVYTIVANGTGSIIRIDGEAVWAPALGAGDYLPRPRAATIETFPPMSAAMGSSGPRIKTVPAAAAIQLAEAVNALPSSASVMCFGGADGASISFTPAGPGPVATVTILSCENTVEVRLGSAVSFRRVVGTRLSDLLAKLDPAVP